MITVFRYQAGHTTCAEQVDPAWLDPGSGATLWVDFSAPTPQETRLLADVFRFHELSIEDAVTEIHHPKIEPYPEYLYLVLHGIDFKAKEHCFRTVDVDFFLGATYLVTVHGGVSRSIAKVTEVCRKNSAALSEGPAALMHRIIDTMVDHYRPEVDKLGDRLDRMEKEIFQHPDPHLARRILDFKRDVASLRRVVLPERDAVGRLARREFPVITEALSYRFRDVYDHLVRLSDEAVFFQDRISSLLDAHLAAVSNALNGVMKVLTIIATVFMPLGVVVGLYGMNVELPEFPGGPDAQFWWIMFGMAATTAAMLWFFRRRKWI